MTRIDLRAVQKKKTFEEWIKGDHVLVHLDSRHAGVEVPSSLMGNPALTLKLSYLFQGETKHDDKEIRVYLRFGSDYALCVLPWSAVWGMTSSTKENRVWQEDVPKELVLGQQVSTALKNLGERLFGRSGRKQKPGSTPTTASEQQTNDRARLTVAAEATQKSPAADGNVAEPKIATDRRAQLRRIK